MKTRRTAAGPTIRYVFADKPLTINNAKFADPQRIGEALAAISAGNEGKLTPEATVNAASDPRHALHPHFEWDDARAAHAHRLDQARAIIRIVRIEDASRDENPPAYISVNEGRSGVSYRTFKDVLVNADLQSAVLLQAEKDLEAWERRYRQLQDVCNIVAEARMKVRARRVEMENRPSA